MPHPFSQTLRALEADRPRPWRYLALALLPVAAWAGWACFVPVTVHEVSDSARLEVDAAVHPVATEVAGRVTHSRLALGRRVEAGEVLLTLDARSERLAVREKEVRVEGLRHRVEALQREIAVERRTLDAMLEATPLAINEAKAQLREAEAAARFTSAQVNALGKLRPERNVSELEYKKAQSDSQAAKARCDALTAGLARLEKDRAVQENERRSRIARLETEVAELKATEATEAVALERLRQALSRREVRAAVAGRLARTRELRPGAVLTEAEELAAIVPDGRQRVVASFPSRVVGRLRPGQAALLRLEGFPWAQYGAVPATVTEVGNDPRDGLVRVELTPDEGASFPVPLEHGAPLRAEVAVERQAPAVLVLRAAGEWLARPPSERTR
jgi:membrane fusion protein (multidrug efflux system)